ncbi:hypothetical protein [Pseudanabaena sp. PCC 6802]|uniref:hypothetical protein n=1 Tax=Pseudanabaena sp. PCC 6802 TaxID=118173 RepID=UPI000347BA42|nr:hypothetical protein [Pseudanabaena sp. PCC 6802]
MFKTMMQLEILEALKHISNEERILVIETAARLMREEAKNKELRKAEQHRRLEMAAQAALPDYEEGGTLHDLWASDKTDYDREDEPSDTKVVANA